MIYWISEFSVWFSMKYFSLKDMIFQYLPEQWIFFEIQLKTRKKKLRKIKYQEYRSKFVRTARRFILDKREEVLEENWRSIEMFYQQLHIMMNILPFGWNWKHFNHSWSFTSDPSRDWSFICASPHNCTVSNERLTKPVWTDNTCWCKYRGLREMSKITTVSIARVEFGLIPKSKSEIERDEQYRVPKTQFSISISFMPEQESYMDHMGKFWRGFVVFRIDWRQDTSDTGWLRIWFNYTWLWFWINQVIFRVSKLKI